MTFDLTKLDTRAKSEAGVDMKIFHPSTLAPIMNDEGKPITITLKGRNSAAYKTAFRTVQERGRERQARGVRANEEEIRADEIEFLSAVTVGWTFTELDGQPFPFNQDNSRRLWSDERFTWILEQATRFAANDGNFLGI